MGRYTFTDRDAMVGKPTRQVYFTELQDAVNDLDDNKVDKVSGKQLSTEDYTTIEKNKLAGIEDGANKYTHPTNHPASIITQDSNNRFVTDAEKSVWNAKETPTGSQTKADSAESNAKNFASGLIGTLSSLATTVKTNIVAAINELKGNHDNLQGTVNTHLAENASEDNVHGLKNQSLALASGSVVGGDGAIAIGGYAQARDAECLSIGFGAESAQFASTAIGCNAEAKGLVSLALGYDVTVRGDHSVGIGRGAYVYNERVGVLGGSPVEQVTTCDWQVPGNFTVSGTKNFEIPHPKPEKSATHRIRHGAVESPTAGDTLYRFVIESTKENDMQYINLPDYFIHLNKDVQIFVTPQGHFGNGYGVINEETEQLEIHCQNEGEYNVLVIGTRNDNHQSVQDWDIKGVEREIGESWTGETYAFSVDEIIEIEEYKEVI